MFEGLLKEGSVYYFFNFFFANSIVGLQMTNHIFKLNFHKKTYVKTMTFGFSHSVNYFCYVELEKIISGHIGKECAIGKYDFVSKTRLVLYTCCMS